MPPTIIRIAKDRNHPYVMIDRRLAEEPGLSWKAKGLMLYLLSRPDDWQVRVSDLVRRGPEGKAAVHTGLRELEQSGYIVRRRHHDAVTGRFTGIRLTVYERPSSARSPSVSTGAPDRVAPLADRTQAGNPMVDDPQPKHPRSGKPQMGNPQMENHPPTNTDITKTEYTKTEKTRIDDVVPTSSPHSAPAQDRLPASTETRVPLAPGPVSASAGSVVSAGSAVSGPPLESEAILAQVVALYEQEIGGCLTAMIHDELVDLVTHECRDPARWRAAFRASIGARNRWKYTRAIILHPHRKPPQEVDHETSPSSDQRRGRRNRGQGPRRGGSSRGDGRKRSVTLPGPEEIARLNREAERQLRAATGPES